MTQTEWPASLTDVIADGVRHYRQKRGMSAQTLADRCEHLGHPIRRSVIANLEAKRRENVSVADVLILARALGVAPLLMMFPLGVVQRVEIGPGVVVDSWAAHQAFTGEQRPGADVAPDDPARIPSEWRRHAELVEEWWERQERVADAEGQTEGKIAGRRTVMVERRRAEQAEAELREVRAALRRQDVTPPALPPELEHLDEGATP